MKDFLRIITPILVFLILIRFFRFLLVFAIKFWIISLPVIIILFLYFRKKARIKKEFSDLDPDKEIKTYPKPTVEEEDE